MRKRANCLCLSSLKRTRRYLISRANGGISKSVSLVGKMELGSHTGQEGSIRQMVCHAEGQRQLQKVGEGLPRQWDRGSGPEAVLAAAGGLGCFSEVIRKSRLSHKRISFAEEILGLPMPQRGGECVYLQRIAFGFVENIKA